MKKVMAILLVAVALIAGVTVTTTTQHQAADVQPMFDPGDGGRP